MTPDQRRSDPMLRPWTRGRLVLPFEAADRSTAQARRRFLLIGLGAGLAAMVIIGALLTAFGMFPQIHHDPDVTTPPGGDWTLIWLVLGSGGATCVAFWVLAIGMIPWGKDAPGRPWRYVVTEAGLKVIRPDGHVAEGPWAEWRFTGYDTVMVAKNAPVVSTVHLSFRGFDMTVPILDSTRQRRMLRALIQRCG